MARSASFQSPPEDAIALTNPTSAPFSPLTQRSCFEIPACAVRRSHHIESWSQCCPNCMANDVATPRAALQQVLLRIEITKEQATLYYTLPALCILDIMPPRGFEPLLQA